MPDRRPRLLLILLLALGGVYLFRNGFAVWPWLSREGDFVHLYRAGAALLAGSSPYASRNLDYPPLMAVLLAPFAALPFDAARIAWFLACHACLLGAAALVIRALGGGRSALLSVAALWALAGTVPENLALGQLNPVLLLLIALAWTGSSTAPGWAAGLKIWPGLLLLDDAARGRYRAFGKGLAVAAACVVVPLLLFAAFLPPPHLPAATSYWAGTPATLCVSLPALALRLADRPDPQGPPPLDWQRGNVPEALRLAPARRALSIGVSLATLALGLLALWRRRGGDRPATLAALTVLATLAAPISWYHYQLFQLPGLALLAARRPAWPSRAGVALLAAGLTRSEVRDLLLAGGTAGAALRYGAALVLLQAALFAWLVREAATAPAPSS
jgi:alpha-1,2-mannosyltransferase